MAEERELIDYVLSGGPFTGVCNGCPAKTTGMMLEQEGRMYSYRRTARLIGRRVVFECIDPAGRPIETVNSPVAE
jgi:hypothetical protein